MPCEFPRTNGQLRRKYFHLMTSSCRGTNIFWWLYSAILKSRGTVSCTDHMVYKAVRDYVTRIINLCNVLKYGSYGSLIFEQYLTIFFPLLSQDLRNIGLMLAKRDCQIHQLCSVGRIRNPQCNQIFNLQGLQTIESIFLQHKVREYSLHCAPSPHITPHPPPPPPQLAFSSL